MLRLPYEIGLAWALLGALGPGAMGLAPSRTIAGEARGTKPANPKGAPAPVVLIAALPFDLAAPVERYAPLAEAFGDMLMTRLASVDGLAFVERAALDKVLAEQERTALMSPAGQVRLGQLLGAKFVLTGSLTAGKDELQASAHLLEVATTRVARSAKAATKADRLIEAAEKLSRELAEGLDLKLPELTQEQIDRSPEANLHFMRGLGYHFARMPDHAIACFMKALASDPTHARARFWNGKTYFDQGEHEHAQIEFGRFLKQFPKHELAPQAKAMADQCAAEIAKHKAAERK